jgi:hypothetical protein
MLSKIAPLDEQITLVLNKVNLQVRIQGPVVQNWVSLTLG